MYYNGYEMEDKTTSCCVHDISCMSASYKILLNFIVAQSAQFVREIIMVAPFVIVRVITSRRMRWVGHVTCMEEGRGVHKVLVGKPEGKRLLGRPRRRWEDNINGPSGSGKGLWGLDGVGSG